MGLIINHQCGHNTNWNIDAFSKNGQGDSLIFSPVNQNRSYIERLGSDIKSESMFDPQFYLPNSQKKKLASYDFFPETIADGFSTADFGSYALEAATQCLAFQVENEFKRVVIPTRFYDQMITDFVERQDAYTVHPFLEAIERWGEHPPVYLTVVLTNHMMRDEKFRSDTLNWLTSYPQVDGVYLIPHVARNTKQINQSEDIFALLSTAQDIRDSGLEVMVGYQNSENLLCSLVENAELSFGAFENTRIFSVDRFIENDDDRRGPRPRIYLAGLLNWIQLGQAKQIMRRAPDLWERIYIPTDQGDAAIAAAVEPTFNQPALYEHHFECVYSQIKSLADSDVAQRYETLRSMLREARSIYDELDNRRIDIERHGDGAHITPWLDAINQFSDRLQG